MGGVCGTHGIGRVTFWWVDPREKDHLEDPVVDGRVILKRNFKKWAGDAWTGELFVVSAQCICVPVVSTTNSDCLLIQHPLFVLSLTYVVVY